MIPPAPGDRCAARAGDYVRRKHGLGLVLVASTLVAISLACGPHNALVGAQDPDEESRKVGAGTSGTGGGNVAATSTGGTRDRSSTGEAGEPPLGGTGEGKATGGSGGTSEVPDMGGGTGGTSTAGGGGGVVVHTCGGATGSAASDGGITPCELVGPLDGRLMQFPCEDMPATDDCSSLGYVVDGVVTSCFEGQSEMVLDHPIAGTPGAHYLVTMHFYGIMEPKNLGIGVTREAAPGTPDRSGGSPLPWATAPAGTSYPLSTYSAYELRVHDERGQEVAQYFLNADFQEGHWTFLIDYDKTIEVVAGGFVRLRRYDANCRLLKNCGATGGPPCAPKARTLDLSAVDPPPPPSGSFPMGFTQPGLNKSEDHAGQWWLIDVTAVEPL